MVYGTRVTLIWPRPNGSIANTYLFKALTEDHLSLSVQAPGAVHRL